MWDVPNYTASSELVGKFGRLGRFGLVLFGLVLIWFGLVLIWFGLVLVLFCLVDHCLVGILVSLVNYYESSTLIPALRTCFNCASV